MNIYRHPRNQAIIATNATHCIYLPQFTPPNDPELLREAHNHLTNKTPRCFKFDSDLTNQMLDAETKHPIEQQIDQLEKDVDNLKPHS